MHVSLIIVDKLQPKSGYYCDRCVKFKDKIWLIAVKLHLEGMFLDIIVIIISSL